LLVVYCSSMQLLGVITSTLHCVIVFLTILPIYESHAFAGALAESTQHTRNAFGEVPRIVAFGNSLTAGLGVSADETYPAQLQQHLDRSGIRYRVVNAGVSGDTTAGGLRRVSWILKSRPHVVILELGGNDGLRGLSLSETRSNLEQIIQKLQEASVIPITANSIRQLFRRSIRRSLRSTDWSLSRLFSKVSQDQ